MVFGKSLHTRSHHCQRNIVSVPIQTKTATHFRMSNLVFPITCSSKNMNYCLVLATQKCFFCDFTEEMDTIRQMAIIVCLCSCQAPMIVQRLMTVSETHSLIFISPCLPSLPPLVPLLPAALPPPEVARLPGRGAVGPASSTLRLITSLILRLPVCLQGKMSGFNPFLCPNSHPSSVTVPPLSLLLQPFHPSVPVLPEALWDNTKSQLQTGPLAHKARLVYHMSRQMGLP